MLKESGVKSAERILDILEILSKKDPKTLTEINKLTGFPKSSLFFLLRTLVNRDFAAYDNNTRRYIIGTRLIEMMSGFINGKGIKYIVQPYLEKITKEIGETSHLSVLVNNIVVDLAYIESEKSMRVVPYYGTLPLHCTSTGKVLMAFINEDRREEILKDYNFEKYTANTITNKNEFDKEVKKIREEKVAFDLEEKDEYVNCIAAPIIGNDNQAIAAIGISGPLNRLTKKKMLCYKNKLLDYAQAIKNDI